MLCVRVAALLTLKFIIRFYYIYASVCIFSFLLEMIIKSFLAVQEIKEHKKELRKHHEVWEKCI